MLTVHDKAIIERHQNEPPIDVMKIASEFGLKVFAASLDEGISGMIVRDKSFETPSGFVIIVDRNEASVRQRFTAAHELGHFLLHRDLIGERIEDNYMLRSNQLSNWQEAQANRFAADLLMPRHLLNKYVEETAMKPAQLAKLFQVSELAMSIRLGLPT